MNKKQFRAEISETYDNLDECYMEQADREIFERLISLPEFKSAKRVFLYCSVGRETDTQQLICYCKEQGKPFALPRTYPRGKMDFCLMDGSFELCPEPPFGIPEPPREAKACVPGAEDVIIVPALAFDKKLFRIGHGGGYYDRYLASCPAHSIGICREKLVFPELPREAFDISVCVLVTEIKMRNR